MAICDICGKSIKRNTLVSDISLRYSEYDGSCYHWNGDTIKRNNISYLYICEKCSKQIRDFLINIKEAKNE